MKKILHKNILLFTIILLAVLLRFYNYPNRISFDRDASLDALVARSGSANFQFPLTGPFSSAAPITTGPWYYYQMIVTNLVVPSVYAPWISFAISSLILVLAMYRVGFLLKDKRMGLVLACVAAISPVQISISAGLGNASLLGQFAGIIIWLYLEITLHKKSALWDLLLGFMIGVSINYHFQAFLLLPFFGYLLFRRKTFFSSILHALLGFIISFLPLLFFDLNNHWFNLSRVYDFVVLEKSGTIEIKRWLTYIPIFWNNLISSVLGVPKSISIIIFLMGFLANIYLLFRTRNSKQKFFLVFIFIFQFLFLRYYRGPLRDNYVQFFHPFIFIFTGSFIYLLSDIISNIFYKYFKPKTYFFPLSTAIIMLGFMFLISSAIQKQLQPNPDTYNLKLQRDDLLQLATNGEIAVYRCKNSNTAKPWSMALMLDINNKLWKDVKRKPVYKIGYIDQQNCPREYLSINESIDLSKYDPEFLNNVWEIVTPDTVYDSMVKWWYEEKP